MPNNDYKIEKELIPRINHTENIKILELGVQKGKSTLKFLQLCKKNNGKLFSVDIDDCSNVSNDPNWKFIKSRDDDFKFVSSYIPSKIDLILLDTVHEAKHVEKIIYFYYDYLNLQSCFFIDDISWIPYLIDSDKNRFYAEINNYETFIKLLEIYYNNRSNFNLDFNFEGTGMCKITKLTKNKLNIPKKIKSRNFSIKNIIRKFIK